MKKLSLITGLIFLCVLFLFANCGKDKGEKKTLTFGVVLPLDDANGVSFEYAIKTAVAEINEAGGIAGEYTLKIDVRSSEPLNGLERGEQAVLVANSLLIDNKDNLVGFITDGSTSSRAITLDVCDINKISAISGFSTSNANSGLSAYFHRTIPADKYTIDIIGKKALAYGINKIAIAVQKGDVYSETFATDFQTKFEALGGIIVDKVMFLENDPDYVTKLQTLYSHNPDAVCNAMLNTFVEFYNKLNDNIVTLNLNAANLKFMFSYKQKNIVEQAPCALLIGQVNGVPKSFCAEALPDVNTNSFKHFASEIKTRFNVVVGEGQEQHYYDAVFIYALAIERAIEQGADINDIKALRIAVNEQIRPASKPEGEIVKPEDGWKAMQAKANTGDVNYEGASGNCDMNTEGDVISNYFIFTIVDNGNGTYSFAKGELIVP